MRKDERIPLFLVEDNFMYSFVLDNMLNEYGYYSITTFDSAESCLDMLDYNTPAAIILDYNLGKGLNGKQAFEVIHAFKPGIPVIILSSQQDLQVASNLLQAGAHDYIEKKTMPDTLDKLVKSIVTATKKYKG